MKIGIITFHWGANYGAILQAFALQLYLEQLGHNVEIINYKPKKYEIRLLRLLCHPRSGLKALPKQLYNSRKNRVLDCFRLHYLHQTKRYTSEEELFSLNNKYDVIISGSDQVLNPSYTIDGEDHPTSAYYLNFAPDTRRIGYSVSFGCDIYPEDAAIYAKSWINNFDAISVRELSGLDIISSLGYKGSVNLTPDPTILCGQLLIDSLPVKKMGSSNRVCVYFLRTSFKLEGDDVLYIDDKHRPLSMNDWLDAFCNSKLVVTNSYHGAIFSMLYNTPFIIILNNEKDSPMNNRFYTLFERLGVTDRICNSATEINQIASKEIDWNILNNKIKEFGSVGANFLNLNL